jgi:hypothetical protein
MNVNTDLLETTTCVELIVILPNGLVCHKAILEHRRTNITNYLEGFVCVSDFGQYEWLFGKRINGKSV